jgi:shikimate 5-dehydrogenase
VKTSFLETPLARLGLEVVPGVFTVEREDTKGFQQDICAYNIRSMCIYIPYKEHCCAVMQSLLLLLSH